MADYGPIESISVFRPFYFRYYVSNVALDIWSDDSVHYHGKIICNTTGFTVYNKHKRQYYGINLPVHDSIASKIVKRFNDMDIQRIFMKDRGLFERCDDCGIREYEYANGRDYFIKNWFALSNQARQTIDSFENFIEKTISTKERSSGSL